jgi:hypothetical protein
MALHLDRSVGYFGGHLAAGSRVQEENCDCYCFDQGREHVS